MGRTWLALCGKRIEITLELGNHTLTFRPDVVFCFFLTGSPISFSTADAPASVVIPLASPVAFGIGAAPVEEDDATSGMVDVTLPPFAAFSPDRRVDRLRSIERLQCVEEANEERMQQSGRD